MSRKYPFYHQYDHMDCGPTCLRMIAKYYRKNYDISYLRDISYQSGDGTTLGGIADAAEKIGFSTLALTIDYETLSLQLPLLLYRLKSQSNFPLSQLPTAAPAA